MSESRDYVVIVGQYPKDPAQMTVQEKMVTATKVHRVVSFELPEDVAKNTVALARVWVRKYIPIYQFILTVLPFNVYMDIQDLNDPTEDPDWFVPPIQKDEDGANHYTMNAETGVLKTKGLLSTDEAEKKAKKAMDELKKNQNKGVEKGDLNLVS